MRRLFLILAMAAAITSCSTTRKAESAEAIVQHDVNYSDYFTDKTMRYDFHHAGNSVNEYYYFDKLI